MAVKGPIPKRSAERRRTNKTNEYGETMEADQIEAVAGTFQVPEPNPRWHWSAKMVYQSARSSAFARDFYEPTDWAELFVLCETLHRSMGQSYILDSSGRPILDQDGEPIMETKPMNGSLLGAITKSLASLGFTEGDRRRLKVEVSKPVPNQPVAAPAADNVISLRGSRFGG